MSIPITASMCSDYCGPNTLCTGAIVPNPVFSCACMSGFESLTGNGQNCVAINQCGLSNGGCQQICTYTGPGTSTCSCKANYTLGSDKFFCSAINNCVSNNGGCQQVCNMTGPATSKCSCFSNFTQIDNNATCILTNPCSLLNGNCSQLCENMSPGLRACSCNPGYYLQSDNVTCMSVNACGSSNGGCGKHSVCTSTGPGVPRCTCETGYNTTDNGVTCFSGTLSDYLVISITYHINITSRIIIELVYWASSRRRGRWLQSGCDHHCANLASPKRIRCSDVG